MRDLKIIVVELAAAYEAFIDAFDMQGPAYSEEAYTLVTRLLDELERDHGLTFPRR